MKTIKVTGVSYFPKNETLVNPQYHYLYESDRGTQTRVITAKEALTVPKFIEAIQEQWDDAEIEVSPEVKSEVALFAKKK